MQSRTLRSLLAQTWASPVFGDSFSSQVMVHAPHVVAQIETIAATFTKQLGTRIAPAEPDSAKVVAQIMPKTVVFCPALAAGELQHTERLSAFALAIGLMYWSDQTMDRGDEAMPYAIELATQLPTTVPKEFIQKARVQATILAGIKEQVDQFARGEDRALVLDCFLGQVLVNEVRVQRLSKQYLALKDSEKGAFLDDHGVELARRITIDAGFPSVSSSLYALYRQEDPALPSLAEVYADASMQKLLQICNVVVRLIDELGDWQIDAGQHPEWGVFNINPFNQPNKVFVGELLRLGYVDNPKLFTAIQQFHANNAHTEQADCITKTLLDHVTAHVRALPKSKFDQYVVLCKRVLEIGYVNRAGDAALGAT